MEPKKITNKEELRDMINKIHFDSYHLCKQSFGKYFPNAGNMGVFCHSAYEYEMLTRIREELTEPSDNPNQKYYKLHDPIVIPAHDDVPEITYTYLYIRKPDPTEYGEHSGDVDFYAEHEEYNELIKMLMEGGEIKGASLYHYSTWHMVQLADPLVKGLPYVSTKEIAERMRVKQN